MSLRRFGALALFCLASAVMAAALIDPLLEFLSNRGAFGPGDFTDHSNLDIVPALLIGLGATAAVIAGLARRALDRRREAPAWLRTCALVRDDDVRTLLPLIYGAQMAALATMETIEQIIVIGRPFGGTCWLGGPVPVSLTVHGLGCFILTMLLARFVRWSATTVVDVVTFICERFTLVSSATNARRLAPNDAPSARFLAPILELLKGRAPPPLPA